MFYLTEDKGFFVNDEFEFQAETGSFTDSRWLGL